MSTHSHSPYSLDWSDLAFGNKKPVNALRATFIAAPRELSVARFTQLVKELLPQGTIILGLAKEPFVEGFESQPQFKTLEVSSVQKVIDKVNASSSKNKIYTLTYFQRETKYILESLSFKKALFVNGSWKYSFHTRDVFYTLVKNKIDYELISPFTGEDEAREYEARVWPSVLSAMNDVQRGTKYTAEEMLSTASRAAALSFDHTFQTGASLGKRSGTKYELLAWSFNKVVPYQTYAMHHGASRERHFSPMNDLNHYDANHAEAELLIRAQREGVSLKGTTLFINLLPCPTCTRMIAATDIAEVMYSLDHSGGYAVSMLQHAGKHVKSATR